MKHKLVIKFLLLGMAVMLALPSFALDGVDGVEWGIFEDYILSPNKYAFNKIFNNEPIRYYILTETNKNSNEPLEKNENVDNLENLATSLENTMEAEKITHNFSKGIENAFNFWFEGTKNMIIKDGRQEEFADIMPILSKKIKLRRTRNLEQADIVFNFVYDIKRHCSQNAAGCIHWEKHNNEEKTSYAYVRIPNPTNNKKNYSKKAISNILVHEIGHYFGLTDQYYLEKKHRGYNVHNNPRIGYKESIMGASYKLYLDCDDVDGFINLIDLTLSKRNKSTFSDRAKKEWASFCNGGNKYFLNDYYRKARVYKRSVADWVRTPFNSYKKILTYDDKGRILTINNGENEITFNYSHSDRDNFISVSDKEKEFTINYGMDDFNIIMPWQGNSEDKRNWGGVYYVTDNKEVCEIYYANKIFNITDGECTIRNPKEQDPNADKEELEIVEDYFTSKSRWTEGEEEKENLILEEYICPLIQKECLFFNKLYNQFLKDNL